MDEKTMKIMVTGGAGFIGSHVVDMLADFGHSVLILDDFSTGKLDNVSQRAMSANVIYLKFDISNSIENLGDFSFYKPDIVIHLAAQAAITTAEQDPGRDLEVNGIGTLNMLRYAMEAGVQRFVYASTSAIYGSKMLAMSEETNKCPDTYYGVSKWVGELYAQMMDVRTTVLRFGNVYGPRQVPIGENQVIARMMRHLIHGDDFYIFGDGEQKRDFVYVEDVARAVVMAALQESYSMHSVYNIAGGNSHSVNEIARMVANVCELPGYDWEYDRKRMDERKNSRMKIDKAEKELGWKPQCMLKYGLQKTADWWKE